MTATLLIFAALAASGGLAAAPAAEAPAAPGGQARIDVDRGETYLVRALFDGAADEALAYRLVVVREGAGGRSSTSQGGAFRSAAGRVDTLSSVRVSAAPGDTFRVTLVVTRGAEPVSETSLDETVGG